MRAYVEREGGIAMLKVGMIRCQQTEDMCTGTADFLAAKEGTGAFSTTGPVEIVGYVTCGGCPGKRAVARAKMMVDRGAEAICLVSCLQKGNPIGFPCPHYTEIRDAIRKKIGTEVKLFEWSH